jgi:hypothetical protein
MAVLAFECCCVKWVHILCEFFSALGEFLQKLNNRLAAWSM